MKTQNTQEQEFITKDDLVKLFKVTHMEVDASIDYRTANIRHDRNILTNLGFCSFFYREELKKSINENVRERRTLKAQLAIINKLRDVLLNKILSNDPKYQFEIEMFNNRKRWYTEFGDSNDD